MGTSGFPTRMPNFSKMTLLRSLTTTLVFSFIVVISAQAQPNRTVGGSSDQADKESSWFVLEANADSVYLVIDGVFDNAKLIFPGDTAAISPGSHHIRLVTRRAYDEVFRYDFTSGEYLKRPVSFKYKYSIFEIPGSYQRIKHGGNVDITTDAESRIFINDDYVGQGSALRNMVLGTHKMRLVHPEAGAIERWIRLNEFGQIERIERYNQMQVNLTPVDRIIPGKAFFKQGRTRDGLLSLLSVSLMGLASFQSDQYSHEFLGVTAGFYLIGFGATFIKPPKGYPAPPSGHMQ